MNVVNKIFRHLLIGISLTASMFASAEVPIEKELKIYQVVEVPGDQGIEEKLVEVKSIIPSSTLEYELTYLNVSNRKLDGIVIRQSIPYNASYVQGSASIPDETQLQVSNDNGMTFQPESVFLDNNAIREDSVILGKKYKALQWVFKKPLAADEKMTMRYRVTVD